MKKLITLLTSFTVLSLPATAIISCDNYQTNDKNSSKLLNNTSKKPTKSDDVTDSEKINGMIDEKNNLKNSNNDNLERQKNDTLIIHLTIVQMNLSLLKNPKMNWIMKMQQINLMNK